MKFGNMNVGKLICCCLVLSMLCGAQRSRAFDWGVNMAGAEFAQDKEPGTYGQDYAWPNEVQGNTSGVELDYWARKNMKLARLPFRWERMQDAPYGNLNEFNVAKFLTFLRQSRDRGIKVLSDCHNYGRYYVNGGGTRLVIGYDFGKGALGDFWKKLIPRVQNAGLMDVIYGWDIMNEPYGLGAYLPQYNARDSEDAQGRDLWFDVCQDTISQIRSVDGSKPIFIPGYQYSPAYNWVHYSDRLKDLYDPNYNLIYEAHLYFDADHSGTYTKGGDFYAETGGNYNRGVEGLDDFENWLRANGKRGFLGEFSVGRGNDWAELFKRFLNRLKNNDSDIIVGATYWCSSPYLSNQGNENIEPDHNYGDFNINNWTDKPQLTSYLDVIYGDGSHTGSGGGGSSTDGISSVNGPTSISPSQNITVGVNYSATTTRKIEVGLKNPYNNYQWLGGATVDVAAGSGTAYVNFTTDQWSPLGNGFIYSARLNDTNGNLIQEVIQNNVSIVQCLKATYFNNMDFTGASVTRLDKTIDFNWGTGSPVSGIAPYTFSVRWTGFIKPQYSQTYTFSTNTDDGVRLWVNNAQLVNKWINQGATTYSGSIALKAGVKYPITMEYFQNTGSASAQLFWSSPSVAKQIVPDLATFPN